LQREPHMNGIDNILELLIDEDWHRTDELAASLELPEPRLREILRFLSDYGFVQYRETDNSVRIQSDLKNLMLG